MTDNHSSESMVNRVNFFSAMTSKLFSRLYSGLHQRSREDDQQKVEELQRQKARLIAERNRQLRQALHRRETEITRLNGILATIDEGIIMQDMEGRIVLINQAAQKLLGTQKNFWESELGTLFDAYRDVVKVDAELAPLGEPTRIQVNNRILGAQLAAVADAGGERLGTMIVLRDVTRDAIADRLKDQFVTAISHELRTPMTVIKGVGEVIASQAGEQVNHRLLETLTRNVDTLDRMVVELLDISEMGAGTFSVREDRVQIETLLWSVINSMAAEIKRAHLDVAVMARDVDHLMVQGDDQRLRWAFGHLLQNAIRYTEPGGHIIIALGLDEENARYLAVDIIDTGVGISEKDLPHVFERFYRGEPRTSGGKLLDPRGLGQGLFVARTVANAHNGSLTVRSAPGEGSVFTVMLPVTTT
jgi:signal transduction histidine kinase